MEVGEIVVENDGEETGGIVEEVDGERETDGPIDDDNNIGENDVVGDAENDGENDGELANEDGDETGLLVGVATSGVPSIW